MGCASYVHVPEENNNIPLDRAVGVDAAEEAHCVVYRRTGAHVDAAAEGNGIAFTVSWGCRKREYRREQASNNQSLDHEGASPHNVTPPGP
jgi:hypothetical protein